MKIRSILSTVILGIFLVSSVFAANTECAQCLVAGDAFIAKSKLDEAINEYIKAVIADNTCIEAKDKLISAQDKRIIELKKQIFELTTKSAPVKTETVIVYKNINPKLLEDKYTCLALYDYMNSPSLTFAQKDENWAGFRGRRVKWVLKVGEVFVIDANTSEVWLSSGVASVNAIFNGKADRLNKGSQVVVYGDLSERDYDLKITTSIYGNYSSSEKIKTFSFKITNCSLTD